MWQPVLMINGYILSILGLSMFVPAALEIYDGCQGLPSFAASGAMTLFVGLALFLSNRTKVSSISLRQGYLITCICWFSAGLFSALPFVLSGCLTEWVPAVFEAISGITGTGATVLQDVEAAPRPVLLWRSMLNGFGGIGIVIFAVALLPFLGIGGMQIFQRENADANDKFMPKFVDIAKWIIIVYLGLVVSCAVLLCLCGMGKFDAVNHALSAVATGGFSTRNASVAYFNSARIEIVLTLFMLLGALPMTFYIMLLRRREVDMVRLGQIKHFLKTVVILVLFIGLYLSWHNSLNFFKALRLSAFNVVSVMTTTGLCSEDFLDWGIWTTVFFFLLCLHGGCIGSTTGSVKVMRWQVMWAYFHKLTVSAIEPNRVVPVRIGEASVDDSVVTSVFSYILLFLISAAVTAIILNFMGYDFTTSISTAVTLITNTGPGITKATGAMGNYAFFTSTAKAILCFVMLLGRLEIVTVLVVFSRSFWKH